jgi:peptidoglycan/LPS O-acetylase OafA/YrhL
MTDTPDASATASDEASTRDVATVDLSRSTVPRINSSVRIPALDGLRGIAILLVLLAHTVFHTTFQSHAALNRLVALGSLSFSGVDLFFVLSGFLIGGILLDHLDSPRYFTTFYLRRA